MSGSIINITVGENGSWGNEVVAITSLLPLQVELAGGGATEGDDTYTGDGTLEARVTLLPIPDVSLGLVNLAQDNVAYGLGGNDTMSGGAGNDKLSGDEGNDRLDGGTGDDILIGGTGRDILTGGEGNDRFVLASAEDSLPTASGRDVITDWGEGDLIDLSALDGDPDLDGLQGFTFRGVTSTPTEARAGEIWVHQYQGNTYVNIGLDQDGTRDLMLQLNGLHTLDAGDFLGIATGQTVIGTAAGETLIGDSANDRIEGREGRDQLFGGRGDDVLLGGGGRDILTGGEGADRFVLTSAADSRPTASGRDVITDWGAGDRIDLSALDSDPALAGLQGFIFRGTTSTPGQAMAGEIWVHQYQGNTYVNIGLDQDGTRDVMIELTGLHRLEAGDFLGLATARSLTGTAGGDTLVGDAADDRINGQGGHDTLYGGAGNDRLSGGAGDDVLVGGRGRDVLTGGTGADRFVLDDAMDSVPAASGRDVITDWDAADVIDLSGLDGHSGEAGRQGFSFLGLTATPANAMAGEVTYHHYKGNTYVNIGLNDDESRDMMVEIRGIHMLQADDFLGLA